jgi:hypothetical protein
MWLLSLKDDGGMEADAAPSLRRARELRHSSSRNRQVRERAHAMWQNATVVARDYRTAEELQSFYESDSCKANRKSFDEDPVPPLHTTSLKPSLPCVFAMVSPPLCQCCDAGPVAHALATPLPLPPCPRCDAGPLP